jgi:hypothetical protein
VNAAASCICVNGPEATCPSCGPKESRLLPPRAIRQRARAYREAAVILDRGVAQGLYSNRVSPGDEQAVVEFITSTIIPDLRARADALSPVGRYRRRAG